MSLVLNIELTYFEGLGSQYDFLAPYLEDSLQQLGITARLHIGPEALPASDEISGNSTLYDIMIDVIRHSSIRQAAASRGEWYINVLVAFRHMDACLGIMFDTFSKRNTRNGCAVFAQEVSQLSQKDGVPFERLFARTVLHEIGHCLNLPHDEDLTVMSQTQVLINSRSEPRWYHNINYDFSESNLRFVGGNPILARPGGRLLTEWELEDRSKGKRTGKELRLKLKGSDLSDKTMSFEVGDMVPLLLQIENVSRRSIRLPLPLNQHDENVQIYISSQKGTFPYRSPILSCGSSAQSLLIRPGEKRLLSLNLFFDSGGYLFPYSGTYKISCRIRKYGGENTWFSSDETTLIIKEARKEKLQRFKEIFTPAFRKHMMLGGGYSRGFLKQCRTYLNDRTARQYGFSVPISWVYIHSLKNLLLKEEDPSVIARLVRELKAAYRLLIREESSPIRRGKLIYELQKITHRQSSRARLHPGPRPSLEMRDYLKFKKIHLERMYAHQKKVEYEEKLHKH